MTAQTWPVPLLSSASRVDAAAAWQRGSLAWRLGFAFAGIAAVLLALVVLAMLQLQGAAAWAVPALGALGLVLTGGTAWWLLRSLVRPLAPATQAALRMVDGDLSLAIDPEGSGELQPLVRALHAMREHLFTVVGQVRTGTGNVAMNAAQIARDNEGLARRTEAQADSLQETAASMEELTAAVRQNAQTAQQANAVARGAAARAAQGGEVMREVVETMGSIRASSHSIRDIIGVIDAIAFQTNILALNAAVEAARAGEQGRGFAVVAAEVRMLAQRCADAAREIKGLIVASVEKVDRGGQRVDEAGRAMGEIVASVAQVAELIGHMDVASQEQSSGIDTINTAVTRIDSTTQHNAALVKAAARTAAALQERAVTLMNAVAMFRLGDREHGNAQEAIAMVEEGCAFLRAHGRQGFIDEVNKLDAGRFIHRDLYLIGVRLEDTVFVAHGNNPGRLGTGPDVKDVDGKHFPREVVRVARERGEGWVDYKWVHPVTNEVFLKSGYVRRAGDLAVYCAIYKA